jgi:hypothetical protein
MVALGRDNIGHDPVCDSHSLGMPHRLCRLRRATAIVLPEALTRLPSRIQPKTGGPLFWKILRVGSNDRCLPEKD